MELTARSMLVSGAGDEEDELLVWQGCLFGTDQGTGCGRGEGNNDCLAVLPGCLLHALVSPHAPAGHAEQGPTLAMRPKYQVCGKRQKGKLGGASKMQNRKGKPPSKPKPTPKAERIGKEEVVCR